MTTVIAPQARCRAGVARRDITPPVGIYHRMWGAALHDRAASVHRPLTATALWMQSVDAADGSADSHAQLILAIDHCILDGAETDRIRASVGATTGIAPERVQVCLSHTHGSCWMSRSRADLPGGEMIGPYLDRLIAECGRLAAEARERSEAATIVFGRGRCDLAAHRDFVDPTDGKIVCGFNPTGPADDTVVVGRIEASASGRTLGTLVNYACHPTTLAWLNQAISPDYIGAMRELIEERTAAPCLFLQGASGDLGPREGFVGDAQIADRNGRQLGYAALAALEPLPAAGTRFTYVGPVVSGATLGAWRHEPMDAEQQRQVAVWRWRRTTIRLPYRPELPTLGDTLEELARWQAEEQKARDAGDEARLSECRARSERMTRQRTRLEALPPGGAYPYVVTVGRCGDVLWVFAPGELYQQFQTELRRAFPRHAVVISTITGDWQPGYLPESSAYGRGIYQETIAAVAQGSFEQVLACVLGELRGLAS